MLESHRFNEWSLSLDSMLPGSPAPALLFGAVTVCAGGFLGLNLNGQPVSYNLIKKNNARAVKAIIL